MSNNALKGLASPSTQIGGVHSLLRWLSPTKSRQTGSKVQLTCSAFLVSHQPDGLLHPPIVRAYCVPLPIMRFARVLIYQVVSITQVPYISSRRIYPSKNSPHQQPTVASPRPFPSCCFTPLAAYAAKSTLNFRALLHQASP